MDSILDLFHQHSRRLATAANVVLVILMSVAIANSVLFVINNLDDDTIAASPTARQSNPAGSDHKVDLAALNLFGKANVQAAPVTVDAPETNLNLELQGVFTAPDPDDSTAIVAERGKSGELYQIGDRLPGNAELVAVFDDYILIKRGGRNEKLMFSDAPIRQQFGSTSGSQAPRRGTVATPGSLNLPPNISQNRLEDVRARIAARSREIAQRNQQRANSPGSTIRDYVDKYKSEIKQNPSGVLDKLGVNPVSDGQAEGYRISGQIPGQMLSQAGLQEGDVILSVNGTPVGNAANDSRLVDQVMAAGRARVEVQRGDRKFFLTVPIPGQ